jgi:hypothetical protein
MPGMLGRILGPPPASQPRDAKRETPSRRRTKADADGEPATDLAVKRRIEKQVRDAAGDRLQSLEVRVSGRNVLIVAKPTWFWQKRGIRRTLETLPALDGYRARIDLDN